MRTLTPKDRTLAAKYHHSLVRDTERVRAAAESLVLPGEKLLAVGRAEVATEGIQNPFAVAVTDRRLAWCEPWTGEPRGSIPLEAVTQLRERDDGKDVRLALHDAEVQLRFGGPSAKALQALRQQLARRDVPREVFSRDPAERERIQRGSLARLELVGPLRGWWLRFRFRRLRRF
jgi:hypothetical protein